MIKNESNSTHYFQTSIIEIILLKSKIPFNIVKLFLNCQFNF